MLSTLKKQLNILLTELNMKTRSDNLDELRTTFNQIVYETKKDLQTNIEITRAHPFIEKDDLILRIKLLITEIEAQENNNSSNTLQKISPVSKEVFIVHGHNLEIRDKIADFLKSKGLKPIILQEKPNEGNTIIEKFEKHSNVSFAVVILTPDDLGNIKDKADIKLNPRARQNVILELGFFMGSLSRSKVCAILTDQNIEKPSDYDGILYLKLDDNDAWKKALSKELDAVYSNTLK